MSENTKIGEIMSNNKSEDSPENQNVCRKFADLKVD